jgi:hypothetical protein
MKKKLKLTKLTIANLDRVKGGAPLCACPYTEPRLAQHDYNLKHTISCAPCPWADTVC